MLFHRPDLAAVRKQRRLARKLSEWTGHNRTAVDILAGCLAVLSTSPVEELIERLAGDVDAAIADADAEHRERLSRPEYRVEAALSLGWSLLGDGRQATLLQVLALTDGGPLSPSLLCQAAAASPGEIDQVVRAGFCTSDPREYICAAPTVVSFVKSRALEAEAQVRLRLGIIQAVRTALLDADHENDQSLELAYQAAWDLCSRPLRMDLRASLAHRVARLFRMRGETASARREVDRTLAVITENEPPGHSSLHCLLLLDRAILKIEAGEVILGLEELDSIVERLQQEGPEDELSTTDLLCRAQLIRAQARAFFMRASKVEVTLHELREAALDSDKDKGAGAAATRRSTQDPQDGAILAQFEGLLMLRRDAVEDAAGKLYEARRLSDAAGTAGQNASVTFAVSLAQAHNAAGRSVEAEALLEEARVRSGGDLDRAPLVTLPLVLHELGITAAHDGRLPAAGTYLDEAAMMAASTLPGGHPTRLQITYSRGLVYLALHDLEQALGQFKKVIARVDPTLPGQQHIALLARSGRALAWYIEGAGRHEFAEEELKEVRDLLEEFETDERGLLEEVARIQKHYG